MRSAMSVEADARDGGEEPLPGESARPSTGAEGRLSAEAGVPGFNRVAMHVVKSTSARRLPTHNPSPTRGWHSRDKTQTVSPGLPTRYTGAEAPKASMRRPPGTGCVDRHPDPRRKGPIPPKCGRVRPHDGRRPYSRAPGGRPLDTHRPNPLDPNKPVPHRATTDQPITPVRGLTGAALWPRISAKDVCWRTAKTDPQGSPLNAQTSSSRPLGRGHGEADKTEAGTRSWKLDKTPYTDRKRDG